ncbi:hypothetical protein ATANTOWER_013991 [Ataeniobius toweri]|uniref:Uncharacterized protein n=1 Tax=Ataeniobius toweri TaxID=208326 RepID=A0ABU7BBP0_9TELE|nr:hypothetical protein [Ataeniobius toweri]
MFNQLCAATGGGEAAPHYAGLGKRSRLHEDHHTRHAIFVSPHGLEALKCDFVRFCLGSTLLLIQMWASRTHRSGRLSE